jgi:hypothetical protein
MPLGPPRSPRPKGVGSAGSAFSLLHLCHRPKGDLPVFKAWSKIESHRNGLAMMEGGWLLRILRNFALI